MRWTKHLILCSVVCGLGGVAYAELEAFQPTARLLKNNQSTEALTSLKALYEGKQSEETKGLALLGAGILQFKLNHFNEAKELLTLALQKPLHLPDYAHYYLGLTQVKLGKKEEAMHELEWVEQSSGGAFSFEARMQLAQMALANKKWSVASRYLEHLERRSRSHLRYPEVLLGLISVDRKLNRGLRLCKWAVKLYSKYPAFAPIQDWGIDLASAKVDGERLGCSVTIKEQQARIRRLQWSGQSDRARKEIDQLKERERGADPYVLDKILAQYLLGEGFVADAVKLYLKYYETQKNSPAYLVLLGNAAARAGELEAAIGAFYRAFKLTPRSKEGRQALFQAAFLSYRFQDYDGAGRKFEELATAFPRSGLSRDAKWHLAWLKYLKGDYKGSYSGFQALISKRRKANHSERDFSNEKMRYWMAMSLLKMGESEKAQNLFVELTSDRLEGYYALASRYRLAKINPKLLKAKPAANVLLAAANDDPGEDKGEGKDEGGDENESEEDLKLLTSDADADSVEEGVVVKEEGGNGEGIQQTSFADPKLAKRFDRARELRAIGLDSWAQWELMEIERHTTNKEYLKTLMAEYEAGEIYNRSSYISQTAFSSLRAKQPKESTRVLWEFAYPRAYQRFVDSNARGNDIPSELVWAIMRAESQYRVDVSSPVGALGLMQLMPFTARQVAGLLGNKDFETTQLLLPETNIQLGSRYLRRLSEKFSNLIPLVAAGYNAGPHRVDEWLYSFGDLEMDEFIEHIPFVETRNYVKKVVRNFQIYKDLYGRERNSLAYLSLPVSVKVTTPPPFRESWENL